MAGGVAILSRATPSDDKSGEGETMVDIVITGTGGSDTLVITATSQDSGSYSLNGGPAQVFSGATSFTFNGLAGNDTFTINNQSGGLFTAGAGGITFNGGGDGSDRLENIGGAATNGVWNAALSHFNGLDTQTILLSGVASVADTVNESSFVFTGAAAGDAFSLTDGALINGEQTTRVS